MNEAETIAELIDPKVKEAGWGKVDGSVVRREFKITNGEIKPGGIRAGIIRADYVLVYKNRKLAVIEAKKEDLSVSEGISQAKDYAQRNVDSHPEAWSDKSLQVSVPDAHPLEQRWDCPSPPSFYLRLMPEPWSGTHP